MLKRLLVTLTLFSIGLLCDPAHAAYQPGSVVQVSSVSTLAASDYSNTPQISIGGYYKANDGGQGIFCLSTLASCQSPSYPSACTPDGGSCISDSAGHTYYRTNLNGDLRQYGITPLSIYDYNANVSTPHDATPLITAAFTALQAKGLYQVHTSGVSIYLGTSPTLGDYQYLSCDGNDFGPYDTGHYEGHPSTLIEAHGVSVNASGSQVDQQTLTNCIIIPEWRNNPAKVSAFSGFTFNYPVTGFTDLEAILGNMIKAGDTAVNFQSARNGGLTNLGIYCFDTGIHLVNPNESRINTIRSDANVGTFTEGGGSSTTFSDVHAQNYCTKQVDDVNGVNIPSSETWSITSIGQGALNSFGTHQCRLTITGGQYPDGSTAPTSDVRTSALSDQGTPYTYGAFIANLPINDVGNGIACKGFGQWAVNKISDDGTNVVLDLIGSQLGTGADAIVGTATWATGGCPAIPACTIMYIKTGDTNSIQAGETVTATGIPTGTLVIGICEACKGNDPYDGATEAVMLDHAATAPGSNAAVSFDGGSYVQQGPCGTGANKANACFALDVTQRFYAGTSSGGLFTQTMPTNNGRRTGASFACNGTVGIKANKMQSFAHHNSYAVNGCNGINLSQQGSDDSNKAEDDYDTIGLNLIGATNKGTASGALSGAGVGANIDLFGLSQSTSNRTTISSFTGTSTGLVTVTTAGSMSGWAKDSDGSLTVAICVTLNASNQCTDSGNGANAEYVTAIITASNTIQFTDRGQFGTLPLALANGWNIVQASVGSTAGVINLGPGGLNTSGDSSTDFMVVHGSLAMTNLIVRGGGKFGFISNNATQTVFTGNIFKDMTIVYDGVTGFNNSRGCGNQWAIQYTWECESVSPVTNSLVIDGTAHFYQCDASAGPVTYTVNAGSTLANFPFSVTKIDATSNACHVVMAGGDTIGGAPSHDIVIQNDVLGAINVRGTTAWMITQ